MTLSEVSDRLDELLSEVAAMFKTGMKITLLVRSPRALDGSQDLVKTNDSIDEAIGALLRRKHDDKQLRTGDSSNDAIILPKADLAALVEALRKASVWLKDERWGTWKYMESTEIYEDKDGVVELIDAALGKVAAP